MVAGVQDRRNPDREAEERHRGVRRQLRPLCQRIPLGATWQLAVHGGFSRRAETPRNERRGDLTLDTEGGSIGSVTVAGERAIF